MKKHLSRCLVQCVLSASMVGASLTNMVPVARAASPIQLGEIAWAGGSLSSNDEWFEVWNTGAGDQSMNGWKIIGASDKPIFFPDGTLIPAKSVFLISNYSTDDPKSVLVNQAQMVTSSVSLSNTALRITLVDNLGTEIDSVGDGHAPTIGSNGTIKASMIRQNDTWVTANTSSGFDAGRTDLGTPGVCDECVVEPAPIVDPPMPPTELVEPTSTLPTMDAPTSSIPLLIETADVASPPPQDPLSDMTPPSVDQTSIANQPTDPTPVPSPTPTPEPETITTFTDALLPIQESTSTQNNPDGNNATLDDVAATTSTITPLDPTIDTTTSTAIEQNIDESITDTETTTTSPAIEETSASSQTETTDVLQTTSFDISETTTPSYELLRLNKFMPQPESGSEWVEITSADPSQPIPLNGIRLADEQSVFFTFTSGTLDAETTSTRIYLKSSRLNNDGDVLRILDPLNRTLDIFTYAISYKGEIWERQPDVIGSWETIHPEPLPTTTTNSVAPPSAPASGSSIPPPPITSVATTSTIHSSTTSKTPKTQSTSKTPKRNTLPAISSTTTSLTPSIIIEEATTKIRPPKTTKTKTPAPKITPKRSTKKASTTLIHPYTFDMLTQDPSQSGIRVSLQGIVGSTPGLLGNHQFVLLAADGRGLLIHAPAGRKLPNIHASIHITGTLAFTDTGVPELRMHSYDSWTSSMPIHTPLPRIVDLLAPSVEDEWSIIHVTGTIRAIHAASASLDLGDLQAKLDVKSASGYRISRLKTGDVIQVTGLLKTTNGDIHILPQSAQDILLIEHAKPKQQPPTNPLNGWIPFAAAGAAIAGTEGTKRLRAQWKERRLRSKLEQPLTTTT